MHYDRSGRPIGLEEERQDPFLQHGAVAQVVVLDLCVADVGLPKLRTVASEEIELVVGKLLGWKEAANAAHSAIPHERDPLTHARRLNGLGRIAWPLRRSEEHTSELQAR